MGDRDAEEPERGRGHVFDAGVFGGDGPVREEHAGHQRGVDAVVAAPGFGVVFEDARGDFADGGVPGGAIAFGIADDEVGRCAEIGAPIEVGGFIGAHDGEVAAFALAGFAVAQTRELVGDLAAECVGFGGIDDTLGFPALEIEIDASEAKRVGAGAGPINAFEIIARCAIEREIALVEQPGVEIDAASERGEAVIGEDEHGGAGVGVGERAAQHAVHVAIHVFDHGLVRVTHVLHTVRRVEDARDHALPGVVERAEEHGLALVLDQLRLLQETGLIDRAFVQRPRVLGHAERGERAEQFREVNGVVTRMTDRQCGIFGVDLDGRGVQREVRLVAREVVRKKESHDAAGGGELQADPGGVFAGLQVEALVLDMQGAAVHAERDGLAIGSREFAGGRVESREGPLGAPQVGRTHGGEQAAVELFGRKGDGHAKDGALHGVAAEDFPEGLAFAAHLD